MNKFTDDDLKRCKKLLHGEMSYKKIVLNNPEIEALLARLEAAEDVIAVAQQLLPDRLGITLQAWRKAAGK